MRSSSSRPRLCTASDSQTSSGVSIVLAVVSLAVRVREELTRIAVEFIVERVERFEWNDEAFEQLVIPPAHKTVLKTLVESQNAGASAKFDDFVSGKGHGLVINLFGNPGTGKSLTAEAMSECTSPVPLCVSHRAKRSRNPSFRRAKCVSCAILETCAALTGSTLSRSHSTFRAFVCCGSCRSRYPCRSAGPEPHLHPQGVCDLGRRCTHR